MTTQPSTPAGAGSLDVEGARLAYRIEGTGPPCLVIGSVDCYARVFSEELRRHLQLAFVDLRHFAPSEPTLAPDRITIDTYAVDIETFRRTLGLGDVVVIGHSVHGQVALEYARRYPEHVRAVVVVGGGPTSEGIRAARAKLWETGASVERKALLDRTWAELTDELRATLSPAELFVREYVADGPSLWYDPTYDATWLWNGVFLNLPILERLGDLLDPYDLAQGPGEVRTPVLIAHGRFDFRAPFTLWEEHRHKLPRQTFALFERSGHFPPLEEPELFDHTIRAWIDGLER
jgi:proline iminopeptidase